MSFSLLMGLGVGLVAVLSGVGPIASIVAGSAGAVAAQLVLSKKAKG